MDIQSYIDEQLNCEALKPVLGKDLPSEMLSYSETNRTINTGIGQCGVTMRDMYSTGLKYGIGSHYLRFITLCEMAQTSLGNGADQRTQAIKSAIGSMFEEINKMKDRK